MVGLDLRYGAESRGAEEAAREEDGEVEEGAIAIDSTSFERVETRIGRLFRFALDLRASVWRGLALQRAFLDWDSGDIKASRPGGEGVYLPAPPVHINGMSTAVFRKYAKA